MKNIILALIVFLVSAHSYAQSTALVLNDNDKLMYYQVNSLSLGDTLQPVPTVNEFIKKKYPDIRIAKNQSEAAGIQGKGRLTLYHKGLVFGQEEGQLSFDLKIDFKEEKYRVMASNLTFMPLQRNRYGTFTPVNGIAYAWEELPKKVKDTQYESYTSQVVNYFNYLNKQLEVYLTSNDGQDAKTANPQRISTKEW
ncbi:hypothetical protein KHS38_18935 [Mucilaginibacter sp. Bleaf8]|uniref:hypothetical protein n=1 Tax=Mucilaginibacter sp. Bleaf8 TaxID=2834430 RepID=UPI001BCAA90E|nr:hypothetical protein [Mucilaginibacter sp. Bleaf8]MBS7566488.1 hypothetical protein [Mucilaginibacter sp. Bleaf8]